MYNKIKVLTFAKGSFEESQKKLSKHLKSIGINNQINLTDNDLPKEFKEKNIDFFEEKRGYGYWIWKPFLIKNEVKKLKEDEILIYVDSTDLPSIKFFNLVNDFFEKNEVLLINRGGYINGDWTKRDCFIHMNCDEKKYYEALQLDAGIIGVKKNFTCLNLLNDWEEIMQNKSIVDDSPNKMGLPNLKNFREHRHDQSILTNLSICKNIKSVNISGDIILFNYHQPKIY
jgi:hypothetical protein